MKGMPVSGPMSSKKAVELSKVLELNSEEVRGGIHNLSVQGEEILANKPAANSFVAYFSDLIKEKNLTLCQIFY